MKVLLAGGGTGGHLFPGLAIARAIVSARPDTAIHFVGAERGVERDILPGTEFPFTLLALHPLYRSRPWLNVRTISGALRSWHALSGLFREFRPDIVVGTGGYGSALPLLAARVRGVPYVLQEQNSLPGLTTRLFSGGSRAVFLGFAECGALLKPGRATELVDSGNPIEPPPSIRPGREPMLQRWGFPATAGAVLIVVGGSQGSLPLNQAVAGCLTVLEERGVCVIWGTGRGHYERFRHHESISTRVLPFISPMSDAYAVATLALSRAGAVTTAELCAWGVPSILVPLPSAAADHQSWNAKALEEAGCSVVIAQGELTGDTLEQHVTALLSDPVKLQTMRDRALSRGRADASQRIANHILAISEIR